MSTKYVAGIQGGDQVGTLVGPNYIQMAPFANPTFIAGDSLVIGPIPAGAMLTSFFIDLPQLDTGTALTIDVGTDLSVANQGVSTTGFILQSTVGRSATVNVITPGNNAGYVHGSIPFVYVPKASAITTGVLPVVCNLILTIATAASTATSTGTIYAYYSYTMVDNANATHAWL